MTVDIAHAGNCSVHILKKCPLVYLATVYTSYPYGAEKAFRHAAELTGKLMLAGVKVFSPIVHGHPLSVHGGVPAFDHVLWLEFDEALMRKSDALAVARMEGWEKSHGIAYEVRVFEKAGKPIYYIDPYDLSFVE